MSTKEEKFLESLRDYIKYCGRAGEILDSIMSEKVSSEEGSWRVGNCPYADEVKSFRRNCKIAGTVTGRTLGEIHCIY